MKKIHDDIHEVQRKKLILKKTFTYTKELIS
jgi:hypothetical protein